MRFREKFSSPSKFHSITHVGLSIFRRHNFARKNSPSWNQAPSKIWQISSVTYVSKNTNLHGQNTFETWFFWKENLVFFTFCQWVCPPVLQYSSVVLDHANYAENYPVYIVQWTEYYRWLLYFNKSMWHIIIELNVTVRLPSYKPVPRNWRQILRDLTTSG